MGYHRQLLKHFYPDRCSPELLFRSQRLIEAINTDTLDLLERAYEFARTAAFDCQAGVGQFGEQLKRDSFRSQRVLGEQVETVLQEIECAAGVRREAPVGISEAFTPLAPPPTAAGHAAPGGDSEARSRVVSRRWWRPVGSAGHAMFGGRQDEGGSRAPAAEPGGGLTRRSWLGVVAGGAAWLLGGCARRPVVPPLPPRAVAAEPRGFLHVAPGHSETVGPTERFDLEAVLEPEDAQVIGEPRVTSTDGEIKNVKAGPGKRVLTIEYQPAGSSRGFEPNVTVTVAWTVRGKETDTVVVARILVHANDEGTYSLGYETPCPTIAEMAAPPITGGPAPPRSKPDSAKG
jgi:hypothetical protein